MMSQMPSLSKNIRIWYYWKNRLLKILSNGDTWIFDEIYIFNFPLKKSF